MLETRRSNAMMIYRENAGGNKNKKKTKYVITKQRVPGHLELATSSRDRVLGRLGTPT